MEVAQMKTSQYNTKLFSQEWSNEEDFLTDWKASGLYQNGLVKDVSIKTLFWLLYQRYGNSPIANMDENQWKLRIHAIIFQYAPTWEKKLDIQATLRALEEADLIAGNKTVHNRADNPSGSPSDGELDELEYISEQSTDGVKRGKLEAYQILYNLLEDDVTGAFINRFQKCFKVVIAPENPLLYETEEDVEL